jgi:uncharacterized protein YndB with AHSA1/START domain
MTDTISTPVRHAVSVPAAPTRAFQIFTTHFDAWWPRGHHIGKADLYQVIIEPKVGGRWYEIGVDGSECEWGTVLVWDAPSRLVVTWQLNGRWEYDPDRSRASEVEVTFHAVDDQTTKVTIEHRHIERMVAAEDARRGVDSDGGWRGIIQNFAALVAASSR